MGNASRRDALLRPSILRLVFALLFVCVPAGSARATWDGSIGFFLGQKWLDGDWGKFDQQTAFGVQPTFGRQEWPVRVVFELAVSADERKYPVFLTPTLKATLTARTSTFELCAGVRRKWELGKEGDTQPFVGGGAALITAQVKTELAGFADSEDDYGIGPWVSGGALWVLGKGFEIGFTGRYTAADVDLSFFGGTVDAGGLQAGALIGYGW